MTGKESAFDAHAETFPLSASGTVAVSPYASVTRMLERREFGAAVNLLEQLIKEKPSHEAYGLLGTVYLLLEQYEQASQKLEEAVLLAPEQREWADKLQRARINLSLHVNVEFPPVDLFERDVLLGPPLVDDDALPPPSSELPKTKLLQRLGRTAGRWLGEKVTRVADLATHVAGLAGTADEVWTNWYRKPSFLGLLSLAYMRQQLDRNNLINVYPDGELTAFQSRGLIAPAGAKHFRTPDGSWNNLSDPKEGAAGVRFPRNVQRSVTWPRTPAQFLTPNPAELSQVLFARSEQGMKEVPFLNLLAAAWIQFNVHDWVSHRMSLKLGAYEIPLPSEHPARKLYHQSKMFVSVTEDDPTRMPREAGSPPTFVNEVTSWWDASQIYGSDVPTTRRLRSFESGKLKLGTDGRLPVAAYGIEDTGFNRNWWLGLSLLHTLFVHEHNAICDMLAEAYRGWDDHQIYNVARLINAAVIAKIHTVEWTPAILPNQTLQRAMNANWYGLVETAQKPRGKRRVFPPFKLGNPEFGGIVGNATQKFGAPFGLTEEFTEIYRLHELLPDELVLRRIRGTQSERVPLPGARLGGARAISDRLPMADLLYSFGNMLPGQLVLHNYPDSLRSLSIPGNPLYDLAAVDILRARERGVPRYNEFRRQLGLKPILRFEDLTTDPNTLPELKRLYENDLEAIDLLVGTRAESQRPSGFGFGETMFQLFILNASRRLQADRFFTESYNEETYTPEGLAWIDEADFKSVLLRHYPELADTGLSNVNNAFEPWDTGKREPGRHPLDAFE